MSTINFKCLIYCETLEDLVEVFPSARGGHNFSNIVTGNYFVASCFKFKVGNVGVLSEEDYGVQVVL